MARGFAKGRYSYGCCQRCGIFTPYLTLRFDGDTKGLKVCRDCYDPEHPQDKGPRSINDPIALRYPAPCAGCGNGEFEVIFPQYDPATNTYVGANAMRLEINSPSFWFVAEEPVDGYCAGAAYCDTFSSPASGSLLYTRLPDIGAEYIDSDQFQMPLILGVTASDYSFDENPSGEITEDGLTLRIDTPNANASYSIGNMTQLRSTDMSIEFSLVLDKNDPGDEVNHIISFVLHRDDRRNNYDFNKTGFTAINQLMLMDYFTNYAGRGSGGIDIWLGGTNAGSGAEFQMFDIIGEVTAKTQFDFKIEYTNGFMNFYVNGNRIYEGNTPSVHESPYTDSKLSFEFDSFENPFTKHYLSLRRIKVVPNEGTPMIPPTEPYALAPFVLPETDIYVYDPWTGEGETGLAGRTPQIGLPYRLNPNRDFPDNGEWVVTSTGLQVKLGTPPNDYAFTPFSIEGFPISNFALQYEIEIIHVYNNEDIDFNDETDSPFFFAYSFPSIFASSRAYTTSFINPQSSVVSDDLIDEFHQRGNGWMQQIYYGGYLLGSGGTAEFYSDGPTEKFGVPDLGGDFVLDNNNLFQFKFGETVRVRHEYEIGVGTSLYINDVLRARNTLHMGFFFNDALGFELDTLQAPQNRNSVKLRNLVAYQLPGKDYYGPYEYESQLSARLPPQEIFSFNSFLTGTINPERKTLGTQTTGNIIMNWDILGPKVSVRLTRINFFSDDPYFISYLPAGTLTIKISGLSNRLSRRMVIVNVDVSDILALPLFYSVNGGASTQIVPVSIGDVNPNRIVIIFESDGTNVSVIDAVFRRLF